MGREEVGIKRGILLGGILYTQVLMDLGLTSWGHPFWHAFPWVYICAGYSYIRLILGV